MQRLLLLLLFASGYAAACAAPQDAPPHPVVAFVDVSVVPMDTAGVLAHHTVMVEDGRIAVVAPAASVRLPADAVTIDGRGRYLMPGLADMHTHINHAEELLPYLANGITTVLNLGSPASILDLRAQVAAGDRLGPTIFAAAFVDGVPGTWAARTPAEAREAAQRIKAEGWDFIKAYNSIPLDAYHALIDEARQHGLAVVGHGVRAPGMEGILDAGQVMIAHAEEYLYTHFRQTNDATALIPSAVAMTARAGAYVVPTLSTYEAIAAQWGSRAGLDTLLTHPATRYVTPFRLEKWNYQNRYLSRTGSIDRPLAFQRTLVKALHDGGVPLLLGTDSPPIPGMIPGFSIHDDLRNLVVSGLTPYEALRAGTRNAGTFITTFVPEAEAFGTVRPGHRADLLLLAANPLDDVAHVQQRVGVMHGGRWFPEATLQQHLDTLAASFARENAFVALLNTQGAGAAHAAFEAARHAAPDTVLFREVTLNEIGYRVLYVNEDADEAIQIFHLNTLAYPASANAYDSLGEAHKLKGNVQQAIENYERSLALDPANTNAQAMLRELRAADGN